MSKRALLIVSILSLLTVSFTNCSHNPLGPQTAVYHEYKLYITPFDTRESIVEFIHIFDSNAKIKSLNRILKRHNYDANIHTGCYSFSTATPAKEMANILLSGRQTPVRLTIKSTRTVGQMARTISEQIMIDSAQIASLLNNSQILDSLGYTPTTVFDMIIPNTYEVYWNISPLALINRLIKEKERFWNEQRRSKANEIGLSPHEVMTLASIIEEETAKGDELPIVAGLYMNRLKKQMLLQADPTVIYALGGERPKRVLKKHLEVDSPYNTYKHVGLPPAPIRFVNPRSIDAVLNYSKHNYIYMCAKEDFSGYHNFATSLSQHNANAARYQRALKAKKQ